MKLNFKNIVAVLFSFAVALLTSCEDKPPSEYIPQYYVEAYLIVDEPIDGIKLLLTQPVQDSFKLEKALVKDATVRIIGDSQEFTLVFRDTGNIDNRAYYFPDTSYKIKPNTQYKLEITTRDGVFITGETTTPMRFDWVEPPPEFIYYPKDTINFKDSEPSVIRWTSVPNVLYYIIMVKCLDTLEYGKYLPASNDEKNRRIYNPFGERDRDYNDLTNWDAVPNTMYPLYWLIFKWFGKQQVTVYVTDFNMLRWILQFFRGSQINPLLTSVTNAIGVFGSASKISAETFVIKNQP